MPIARSVLLVAALVTWLATGVAAMAQSGGVLTLVADQKLNEVYLDNPKVSGSLLVGVRWAARATTFDPRKLAVELPNDVAAAAICVQMSSKDGRYTSEGLFAIPKGAAGPHALAYNTRYPAQLQAYHTEDIAVMVREAASCGTAESGPIIPLRAEVAPGDAAAAQPRILELFVNADPARTAAELAGAGGATVAGTCEDSGSGVRIAFSTTCRLNIAGRLPSQAYRLTVTTKERFKAVPNSYTVLIAR